jgi:hypothetical protein
MAAATSQSFDAYLKDMWTPKAVNNLVLQDNEVYGMLEKDDSWKGDEYRISMSYGDTGGFSADFGTAQANKQPTSEITFKLSSATTYSLFSVARKVIRQSRDKGAVVEVLGRQTAAALNSWKRKNGIYTFGNGGGALAVVASVSGASLVLTTEAGTQKIELNDSLEFSSTDGTSGSARAQTSSVRVTAVDVATKTLTGNVNWTTACPGLTAGDYVFIEGTFGAVIKGFDAWLPATVTSTPFFQVDRTLHKTRLGGQRINALGLSPRQAAKRAANEIWKAGGKADWYILGPERYQDLISDLESAGNMVRTVSVPSAKVGGMSFGISYDAIAFQGPRGEIKVTCDYNCSDDVSWMLAKKTWVRASIGGAPYLDNMGGETIMREGGSDSYEGRWVGDEQMGCTAPGWNCRVNHTT